MDWSCELYEKYIVLPMEIVQYLRVSNGKFSELLRSVEDIGVKGKGRWMSEEEFGIKGRLIVRYSANQIPGDTMLIHIYIYRPFSGREIEIEIVNALTILVL